MNLIVNGASHRSDSQSVGELIKELLGYMPEAGFAIAVNGHVVPHSQWDRELLDGDHIDVLTAVQGG